MSLSTRGNFSSLSIPDLLVLTSSEDEHGDGCGGSGHDGGHEGEEGEVNVVIGSNNSETLSGGTGRDAVYGYNGDDTLFGLQGADTLEGARGDDFLDGGAGADKLYGGKGNDEMYGSQGKDALYGQNGDDLLVGGCGPDVLDGGKGDDILDGGKVADVLTGGQGSDLFILQASHSGDGEGHSGGDIGHEDEGITDIITDFQIGVDRIILGSLTYDALAFSGSSIWIKGSNQALAILTNLDTTKLTAADFL